MKFSPAVQTSLEIARGWVRGEELARSIIEIGARLAAGLPLDDLQRAPSLEGGDLLGPFEAVAKELLGLPREERLAAVMQLLDADKLTKGEILTREAATDQLLGLVGDEDSARFSYGMSLRAFLTHAVRQAESGGSARCTFSDLNSSLCAMARDLCHFLELPAQVTVESPGSIPSVLKHDCDVHVIMPPFGLDLTRYLDEVPPRVLSVLGLGFGQGKAGRITAEMYAVVDALHAAAGRVLISVSDAMLFRMVGAEQLGRRHLVDSRRLRAVLGVPSGMMFENTQIRSNILAISAANQHHDAVRIVDLGHESVAHKARRGRHEIRNDVSWSALLEPQAPSCPGLSRDVPIDEIAANNFVLTPDRYLNTGAKDRIDTLLAQHEATTLGDVVEMIRPISLTESPEGEYQLLEAAPADVNDRGYLDEPQRVIAVDRPKYLRALNQQLHPDDIVLSIKGNIGVVGIVPDDVPVDGEQSIWTAGQSMMILRMKRRSELTPVVLYEYLSSATVQEFIRSISGGAGISTIAMKDLNGFPVPLPDPATAKDVHAVFERRQALFGRLDEIKREISRERTESWPHRDLGDATNTVS